LSYWNLRASEQARKEEANRLFQRGRELWQNRSASGLHEATLLLERSIELDPGNALAQAAPADAYAFDARNWKRVEQVASEAIRLDPATGNPHASIGFIRLFWQWDLSQAEQHFKQAISASPDYATAHQWYGIMLATVGHFNEALKEMQLALELEPNSVAINADLCQMLYFVGRNFEAEAQCERTLEIDPNYFNAHSLLYQIYSMQGRDREAFEAFLTRERLALNAASLPADFEQYRAAFDRGGLKEFWREHVRLRRRYGTECGIELAWVHASLGEEKEAIACLQRAAAAREFDLVFIYADPVLRRLGENSDYDEIADRMMRSQLSRSVE
jgi:tetratricopeptide (TPR) repeat protein